MKFFTRRIETPPPVDVPAIRNGGFFSTDVNLTRPPKTEEERLKKAMEYPFQRTAADFVPVDASGQQVAMDADYECAPNPCGLRGGGFPAQQLEWYAGQSFIGYNACAILAQNWMIDKACRMPGEDAVRHGWEYTGNDGQDIDPRIFQELYKWDKRLKIKVELIQFVKMARIFGIRHCLFLVDFGTAEANKFYYENPYNPDAVKQGSYKGISQIDPYWISPELDASSASNPANPNFYEPTWWRVNGQRIHRSHFVIMRPGGDIPDLLKPTYLYGGIPTTQKIFERVYAAESTANEAPKLAMTKRLMTYKTDMDEAMANQPKFSQRMVDWIATINNFGVKVADREDTFEMLDTSLTGLDETIMTQYQLVAAAAEVPGTRILETTPKGFNSTGDYETKSYHERLESLQENDLTPFVERHVELCIRSYVAPKFGMKPFEVDVAWFPVSSLSASELAEINERKSNTARNYAEAGAIDGYDVRQGLIKDRDSGYSGMPDIVPDGPGDREAEQEEKEALLAAAGESNENPDEA